MKRSKKKKQKNVKITTPPASIDDIMLYIASALHEYNQLATRIFYDPKNAWHITSREELIKKYNKDPLFKSCVDICVDNIKTEIINQKVEVPIV